MPTYRLQGGQSNMTQDPQDKIIKALHAMELRFSIQLATVQQEVKQWRETQNDLRTDIATVAEDSKAAAAVVATTQAADRASTNVSIHRLNIAVVLLAAGLAGRWGTSLYQMVVG